MLVVLSLLLAQASPDVRTLQVTGLPVEGHAVAVLLNATGPTCRHPLPLVLDIPESGRLALPVTPGCWKCTDKLAGLAIASRDRSTAYKAVAEICQASTIKVSLSPRQPVQVHVWPSARAMAELARDDIFYADWVLNESRAGVTLRPVFHSPNESIAQFTCATALKHTGLVRGQINLYYGHELFNTSCKQDTSTAETEVVFVNDKPVLGIAAHELGHKLGANKGDHVTLYPRGHTTKRAGFNCANNLWEGAHGLNTQYSLGQAIWMQNSCSSFIAKPKPQCLICKEGKGDSPCPPMRLEQERAVPACAACTFTQVKSILGAPNKNAVEELIPDIGERVNATFCTGQGIEQTLGRRFDLLSQHPAVGELRLQSASRQDFIARWTPHMKVAIGVDALLETKDRAQQQELVPLLKGQTDSRYIDWVEDQLNQGKTPAECFTGNRWKPVKKKTPKKP